MKTALLIVTSFFITLVAFSQSKTVVFKVRKAPTASTRKIVVEEKTEPVFLVVEQPATFQGGDLSNFSVWVIQNLKYPEIAIENEISGKVYVQFIVNANGVVENVTVLRGVDPSLDAEAIRVISKSPRWTSPKQGGRNVSQIFTLPVVFKLQE